MQVEAFPRRQLQDARLGRQRRTPHGKDELRVKHFNSYRQEDGTLYPRIYHGYVLPSTQCQVQRSPMFTVVHIPRKPHLNSHVITAVAIRREREDAPGTYLSAVSSVFSPFSSFNQARAVEETNFVQVQIKAIYDTILAAYNASNYMKFHGCRAIVIQIDQEMEWIARVLCRLHDLTEKASYDEIKLHQFLRYPELLTQLNGLIEGFEATTMLRVQFWPTDKEELGFAYQLVEKALDLHMMPAVPYDETLFDASDYDGSDYSIEDEELIDCVNSYEDDSHLVGAEPEDGDESVDVQLVMNLGQQQVLQQGQVQVPGQNMDADADATVIKTIADGATVAVEEPGLALSPSAAAQVIKNVQTHKTEQIHSAGTTTTVNTITTSNANNTINGNITIADASKTIDPTALPEPITPPNHGTAITTTPPIAPNKVDSALSTSIPTFSNFKPTLSPVSISVSDVLPRHWRLPSLPDFDNLPFSYSPPKKTKLDESPIMGPHDLLPSPLPRPSSPTTTTHLQGTNTLLGGIVGFVNAMKNGGGSLLGELGKGGELVCFDYLRGCRGQIVVGGLEMWRVEDFGGGRCGCGVGGWASMVCYESSGAVDKLY